MLTLKLSPTSRFFFSFSCSSLFLDGLAKVFHVVSVSCCCRHVWPGLEVLFWPNCQIIVSTSWNFVHEKGMPCALEINSDGGFKWGHEESCPSLTKNRSPLPQFLWLSNLQSGDLPWGIPTDKTTWPFDYVVLQDHVTNLKHILITRVPMATKLGWMVTWNEELLLIKLHDPSIMWFG